MGNLPEPWVTAEKIGKSDAAGEVEVALSKSLSMNFIVWSNGTSQIQADADDSGKKCPPAL